MKEQIITQKILNGYVTKEPTAFEKLKSLDKKAKKPARVFGYVFGGICSLIFGAGMSLCLLGSGMGFIVGLILGVVGGLLCGVTYPLYKALLNNRKEKYKEKIVALSNEILKIA